MASLELEARLDNLLSTAQAETANVDLFAPIPEREECPICMVTLPIINTKGTLFHPCCGKIICGGCIYKSLMKGIKDNGADSSKIGLCAFCRQQAPENDTKAIKKLMKKKNPHAFMHKAERYKAGAYGVFQSYTRALEMYTCAAELGNAEAFEKIGSCYHTGIAVEQDKSKALEYWEVAAKKGCIKAHLALAGYKVNADQHYTDHLKVAASAGDKHSMDALMKLYKLNELSKEELTQTLRAFQASTNEMKSKDRDDYVEFLRRKNLIN